MSEILFADDDAAFREMVGDVLGSAGHEVRTVPSGRDLLAELERGTPDLVMLDYQMGQPDGFEVCRRVKADGRWGHIPVLILTGRAEMEQRLEGFEAGADDYLPKPFDNRELLARVGALLRLSERALQRNPTTELPGGEAIDREFTRWSDRGAPFAVCYLDLDRFKPFGDRWGFKLADEVIRGTGQALQTLAIASGSFVGHVGGDDFIMFTFPGQARQLSEQAQRTVAEMVRRHVPAEVARAGAYEGRDRDGRVTEIPLTRLAVAIVWVQPGRWTSLHELGSAVAEAKQEAKRRGGIIYEYNPT